MSSPVLLGEPVLTSRQWTTALAPRVGGGHKFICQSWSYDHDQPTEWVLVNLEEGTYDVSQGPNRIYSQGRLIPSANTAFTTSTQIRASDGKIYFIQRATPGALTEKYVNVAYYDPADEQIHQITPIEDPNAARHAIVFNAVFNHSGDTLFCGTQASGGYHPMVFSIDAASATPTVICSVGVHESAQPKYAYYLAADGDWLYVAVGQDVWELVAIDLNTNTPTVLLTTSGPGMQRIEFETRTNGFSANTYSNGVQTRYWMADGALSAYPGSGAPPGGARAVAQYTNPVPTPPQIDWSRGIGQVLWRPYGSTGEWTLIEYEVEFTDPVAIQSLTALSDGSAFGNTDQYCGFFSYDPDTDDFQWYGAWEGGVSSPTLLPIDANTVYIAGYPSGALYRYDPEQTWNVLSNPEYLGSYGTNVRYPYFLQLAESGKLYAAGRRERDSEGSGLGVYDIAEDTFTTTTTGLDDYGPRGFVLLEDAGLLVFSGELLESSELTEAQVITYDLDMVEQDRWTIVADRTETGELFWVPGESDVVIGVSRSTPPLLYRLDVVTGDVLDSVDLTGSTISGAGQSHDGSVWAVIGDEIVSIDHRDLSRTVMGDATGLVPDHTAISRPHLYLAVDTQLYHSVHATAGEYIRRFRESASMATRITHVDPIVPNELDIVKRAVNDHADELEDVAATAVARMVSVGPVAAKDADIVHALYDDTDADFPGPFTNPDVPRNLRVTMSASWDGGDVTVTGTDQFDAAVQETFATGDGVIRVGTKIFKTVTGATKGTPAGVTGSGASIGTGDKVGLLVHIADNAGALFVDGTPEAVTLDPTYDAFTPTTTPSDTTYLVLVNAEVAEL